LKDSRPIKANIQSSQEHLKILEVAVAKAIQQLQANAPNPDKSPKSIAGEAVKYALAHLAEREAAFQHKDVLEVALKHVLGESSPTHIQQAVLAAEKQGDLVRGVYSKEGTRWTTRDAIQLEREIIDLAKSEQGQLSPLVEKKQVEKFLEEIKPKEDHRVVIQEWMSSNDRVLLVQGRAGTGKTTMLKVAEPLLNMITENKHDLLCLAPTHKAVKELRDRDLTAQTLDSFLAEQRLIHAQGTDNIQKHGHNLIIAIDENSMTSNRRMRDILAYTKEIQARLIAIGDIKQQPAIESGKPHTLLQSIGIKTLQLNEIIRQKNPMLLESVQETYRENFEQVFKLLKDQIVEIGEEIVDKKPLDNQEVRLAKIAEDYVSLSPKERATTAIVTLGNAQRKVLNQLVLEGLSQAGEVSKEREKMSIYVSKDRQAIEHTHAANFEKEDILSIG